MDESTRKVLSRLQNLCSRREYCSSDILAKASKALDGNDDAAAEVLSELRKDRYVDDFRYACAFARDKSSLSGWGPVKIRYALSMKRIDRKTIESALEEIDAAAASEKLEKLLQTRWKALSGDPQARLKLIRFALTRGYGYDQVADAVKRITE